MIWLTWRQFRGQAVTAALALAAIATHLAILGVRIRHSYEANVDCGSGCSISAAQETLEREYFITILMSGFLIVLVPALIGIFWGAPLIARELETGTHRLVWNQSVTRTRWLTVKLAFVTLAGVVLTGALSLLFTWAAQPYDKLVGDRFDALIFPTRNVAPLGYAVFAIVLGSVVGLIMRRTVPAMAVTLAVFIGLQILLPATIRPHLQRPITETVAFNATTPGEGARINSRDDGARIEGYAIPSAWVLTASTPLLDAAGDRVTEEALADCLTHDWDKDLVCMSAKDMHFTVSYQPANRYWTFQWLELATYLLLAGLLAGFAYWRISRKTD